MGSDTNNSETDVGGHNKKRNAQGVFFLLRAELCRVKLDSQLWVASTYVYESVTTRVDLVGDRGLEPLT